MLQKTQQYEDKISETVHTAKAEIKDSVKANMEKMEAQLKEWDKRIDGLAVRADNAGTQVKADYNKQIDDLKTKRRVAQSKFDELKKAGSEKWEVLKSGVEGAWKDLESTFKNLKNH